MGKRRNPDDPIVVKKYANRRLYDTGSSSYVTLDDLYEMVKKGLDFVVLDAKTDEDITRSVLTQIIVDQESKDGEGLLPTSFLKNLIGFYGDNMQQIVPNYLDTTFSMFVSNQEKIREQISKSFEGMAPVKGMSGMFQTPSSLEELNRRNMEMFEKTMKMFAPFGNPANTGTDKN